MEIRFFDKSDLWDGIFLRDYSEQKILQSLTNPMALGNIEFCRRIRVNKVARGRATFQSCGARTSRNE